MARSRRSPLSFCLRLALGLLLAVAALGAAAVLPLRWFRPPATMVMLLAPGPFRDVHYDWVARRRIAATVAEAVIASEDQKFLSHHGFDFASIDAALAEYRDGEGLRGASTITQQVAKNVFLWPAHSFVRKGLEAYLTVLLEAFLSKRRILEIYLNVAQFGPHEFGVEAAARRLLHRDPAHLSPAQAALLAAVLPNPEHYSAARPSAYVRERQAEIEEQMRPLAMRGHYRGLDWTR